MYSCGMCINYFSDSCKKNIIKIGNIEKIETCIRNIVTIALAAHTKYELFLAYN